MFGIANKLKWNKLHISIYVIHAYYHSLKHIGIRLEITFVSESLMSYWFIILAKNSGIYVFIETIMHFLQCRILFCSLYLLKWNLIQIQTLHVTKHRVRFVGIYENLFANILYQYSIFYILYIYILYYIILYYNILVTSDIIYTPVCMNTETLL